MKSITYKSDDYMFNDNAQLKKTLCTEDEILRSALIVCGWDRKNTEEFLVRHGGEDNDLKDRLIARLYELK